MAEDPKQVLPEDWIAAAARVEEWPIEHPLELKKDVTCDQRRESEEDHTGYDEYVPGVERHQVEPHAGRAAFQRSHDQFNRRGKRGNLDERQTQQPDVRAIARRVSLVRSEWRVHEPACVRRGIEENGSCDEHAADHETPESECRQARKGQITSAKHFRKQNYGHCLEDRNGEKKHHHRAVKGINLIVEGCREKVVLWHRELHPHCQRQYSSE